MIKIIVVGVGSWGIVLVMVLVDNGYDVCIWGNCLEFMDEINMKYENSWYFLGIILLSIIVVYFFLEEVLVDVNIVLLVVLMKVYRDVL